MPRPGPKAQADDEWCDCCKQGCDCGDCEGCTDKPVMDRPVRPREGLAGKPAKDAPGAGKGKK